MTHLDPSSLAKYNALYDPHLEGYFSNERMQSHLRNAGLIDNRGTVLNEREYRERLAKQEHRKYVRQMLAESIVNRAVDLERSRQAELRKQQEYYYKAALVNNIRENQRQNRCRFDIFADANDYSTAGAHRCQAVSRPKSAHLDSDLELGEPIINIRPQSANTLDSEKQQGSRHILERRHRRVQSPTKRSKSLRKNRCQSATKSSESFNNTPPCQITMIYKGPHTKVDYDHLVFNEADEIMVLQQHCGGENRTVYKKFHKAGDEFTFYSRRHPDFPFGLSMYVNGMIDSRISTCCEYKHRRGVKLGGDLGHFLIKSVKGSKMCIKCRFEKQARMKKLGKSSKNRENDDEGQIKIPIQNGQNVKDSESKKEIFVPEQTEERSYEKDFDDSENDRSSTKKPSRKNSHRSDFSNRSNDQPIPPVKNSIRRSTLKSSSSSDRSVEKNETNWTISIHPVQQEQRQFQEKLSRRSKDPKLEFCLVGENNDETKFHAIKINSLLNDSMADSKLSFQVKLKSIKKPKQIRLKLQAKDGFDSDSSDDDEDRIRWNLDRIEVVDQSTNDRTVFLCKEAIEESKERIFRREDSTDRRRETFETLNLSQRSDDSTKTAPKRDTRPVISPISNHQSFDNETPRSTSHRSTETQSEQETSSEKQINKYKLIIVPSSEAEGTFRPNKRSYMFLKLNGARRKVLIENQSASSRSIDEDQNRCPHFLAGVQQEFSIKIKHEPKEKLNKLTIGYSNSDKEARQWKINKIVLINEQTNKESIFICRKPLIRAGKNDRAEQTFVVQAKSDTESDEDQSLVVRKESNSSRQSPKSNNEHESQLDFQQPKTVTQRDADDEQEFDPAPRRKSLQSTEGENYDYRQIFKQLDPYDELGLGSSHSSKEEISPIKRQSIDHKDRPPTVDPLEGLEDIAPSTTRSEEKNDKTPTQPSSVTNNQLKFTSKYKRDENSDDQDD